MLCQNCGKKIPDNAKFCSGCGSQMLPPPNFVSGPHIKHPVVQPQNPPPPPVQYQPYPAYQAPPRYEQQPVITDSSSPGAFVLGLLLPIVISLIMYLAWCGKTPLKARSLLIGFLIRIAPTVLFIVWFVYNIIVYG